MCKSKKVCWCLYVRVVFTGLFLLPFNFSAYGAEALDLNTALQNTYRACVNIDDDLHDLKVLAGVNTAVTAVGTGLGVGAVATGFAKASTDKEIEELEKELERLSNEYDGPQPTQADRDAFLRECEEYEASNTNNTAVEIDELTKKSKKLGNWRTGLLAGNTATNIAGAIISSKTIKNQGLQEQIDTCVSATKALNDAIIAARMNSEDIEEAKNIYEVCREYEYVDISPISNRGKGAMISSTIGAGLGGVGTITSAVVNSDKTRNDNTDEGRKKEKNLNTASNVLAVGATAASATATVFNATQIAAVKKIAKVSEKCTGVLKW